MYFYDRYVELCREKNVSPSKAALENGINKGTVSVWKSKREDDKDVVPSSPIAKKLAEYFRVSVDYLLGNVSEPYFHLDNERILSEINTYEDDDHKEKPATNEGDGLSDLDKRWLMLIHQMTEEQQKEYFAMLDAGLKSREQG
jgi:transcriptional regulator with XRE-family HTH domain